jgi:hypothetical protein
MSARICEQRKWKTRDKARGMKIERRLALVSFSFLIRVYLQRIWVESKEEKREAFTHAWRGGIIKGSTWYTERIVASMPQYLWGRKIKEIGLFRKQDLTILWKANLVIGLLLDECIRLRKEHWLKTLYTQRCDVHFIFLLLTI